MRPSLIMSAGSQAHSLERGPPVRIVAQLDDAVVVDDEDLVKLRDPVRGVDVRVDDDQVLGLADDLGTDAVTVGDPAAHGLDHLLAVPAEEARPDADPDDVRRHRSRERLEVALLDHFAEAHECRCTTRSARASSSSRWNWPSR